MTEAKLKTLKVVDLKDILSKASVSLPAKANKQDLIARILGSTAALEVYNRQQNPNAPSSAHTTTAADDLLAPPEDFDWEGDGNAQGDPVPATEVPVGKAPITEPVKSTKPASKPVAKPVSSAKKPAPAPAATPSVEPAAVASATEVDEELEKRRKRAERFGMPLVENPKPRTQSVKQALGSAKKSAGPARTPEELEKIEARAARFGVVKPSDPPKGQKRAAEEVVDPEELEKRKKRAERFGIPAKA